MTNNTEATNVSASCYDCGEPATHRCIDAYGPGEHMDVCATDAAYYTSQGENVSPVVPS